MVAVAAAVADMVVVDMVVVVVAAVGPVTKGYMIRTGS